MIENSAQKIGYSQTASNYKGVGRLFENIAQIYYLSKHPIWRILMIKHMR
jgi:hypothetical protein